VQWPCVIEGFILKYRDWIRGDAVVREVCHAHLLRLTRLRLLAPMQTQHCLKMLNGTCTPCPDYMFDHLRPADPEPHAEDNAQEEELAEAERREERVVARLAALQKAAAGSEAVVGLKRPALGSRSAHTADKPEVRPEVESGNDGPEELVRLLGSDLPTNRVSSRVKSELLKLDNALATKQPATLHAGASTSSPKKLKLIIKKKPRTLPPMFKLVSPSEYPKAAQRQITKHRTRRLTVICFG
jgi:hypothetical protein